MLPSPTADVAGIGDFVNDLTSNLRHLMETGALEESMRGTRRMQSAAQRIVDQVSDLRRTLETTPQGNRVLAGIVAGDDWAAIFQACRDDQRTSVTPRRSLPSRSRQSAAQTARDGVRGSSTRLSAGDRSSAVCELL